MVLTFPSPAGQADVTARPELNDADYFRRVLCFPDGASDIDVEKTLLARAAALGLEIPITAEPLTEEPTSSSDESGPTVVSHHGRNASTSSNGTAGTGLTSQTSHRSTAILATLTEPTNVAATRRRSKSLTFSQYEKYVSQLDPALNQPRFHSPHKARSGRPRNMFTNAVKRKGIVKDLKRTLTTKLRRRKSSSATM